MACQRTIENYFNKSFEFTGNEHWVLPTEAFKTPPWHLDAFQQLKIKLNAVKGQLSEFNLDEWSRHTRARDPSSFIISTLKTKGSIELLTQAWCKFYECLSQYPVVPNAAIGNRKLASLHLCEAPGAFVSALNRYLYTHHRRLQWTWHATTLNPSYEANPASDMIADDRLIRHTGDKWDFGVDQTGDLMKYYNHEDLVRKYGGVMLVTADGSVDCMKNPGEQESSVHFLHYCETMTALEVLGTRGTFVLKTFTMFEHSTICLMYLLTCCFGRVHVFKPCSSKSGNSEVYVICLDYKGSKLLDKVWGSLILPYRAGMQSEHLAMFPLSQISPEFLRQLEECAEFFMHLQSSTINDNVRHFVGGTCADYEEIDELKGNVAEFFIRAFPVAFHVPKRCKLMKGFHRRPAVSEHDWDCKVITVPSDVAVVEFGLLLDIKIGRALETVIASKFCNSFTAPRISNPELPSVSSPSYELIQDCGSDLPQHAFQRTFFYAVKGRLDRCCDLVVLGIPLLTRFLAGAVYILALGFESVLVYKQGMLVFRNPSVAKMALVRSYYDEIDAVYRSLKVEEFVPDILQVVPNEVLENGSFYEAIYLCIDSTYCSLLSVHRTFPYSICVLFNIIYLTHYK